LAAIMIEPNNRLLSEPAVGTSDRMESSGLAEPCRWVENTMKLTTLTSLVGAVLLFVGCAISKSMNTEPMVGMTHADCVRRYFPVASSKYVLPPR